MLLLLPRLFINPAGLADGGGLRDLGNGHVPPRFVAGDALLQISFHDDDRRAGLLAGFGERGLQFPERVRPEEVRAEAAGVGSVIDRHGLAVELAGFGVASTVARAERAV